MRKLMSALLIVAVIAVAGCLKTDTPSYSCPTQNNRASDAEVATLKAYLDSNGIVATKDSRGFFYTIDSSASTVDGHPTTCSSISVSYVAKLTSGKTVDSQNVAKPVTFVLGGAIVGWQEAIPLMKVNSTMNLYLPPSLAYGSAGYGGVPGNAILIYKDIKLQAFGN